MNQSLLDRAAEHFGHQVTWDGHSTGHAHIDTWLLRQEFDAHAHPASYAHAHPASYAHAHPASYAHAHPGDHPAPKYALGQDVWYIGSAPPVPAGMVICRTWTHTSHQWKYRVGGLRATLGEASLAPAPEYRVGSLTPDGRRVTRLAYVDGEWHYTIEPTPLASAPKYRVGEIVVDSDGDYARVVDSTWAVNGWQYKVQCRIGAHTCARREAQLSPID